MLPCAISTRQPEADRQRLIDAHKRSETPRSRNSMRRWTLCTRRAPRVRACGDEIRRLQADLLPFYMVVPKNQTLAWARQALADEGQSPTRVSRWLLVGGLVASAQASNRVSGGLETLQALYAGLEFAIAVALMLSPRIGLLDAHRRRCRSDCHELLGPTHTCGCLGASNDLPASIAG